MRYVAMVLLGIGLAAIGLVLWDVPGYGAGRGPRDMIIVADATKPGEVPGLPDGVVSDSPSGRFRIDRSLPASSGAVGVVESVGAVLIGPASEFFGVEQSASASRWAGAAMPLALSLLFWVVPSPFRRKAKQTAD